MPFSEKMQEVPSDAGVDGLQEGAQWLGAPVVLMLIVS